MEKVVVIVLRVSGSDKENILLNRTGDMDSDVLNDFIAGIDGYIDMWGNGERA